MHFLEVVDADWRAGAAADFGGAGGEAGRSEGLRGVLAALGFVFCSEGFEEAQGPQGCRDALHVARRDPLRAVQAPLDGAMRRQSGGHCGDPVACGFDACGCLLAYSGVPAGDAVGQIGAVGGRAEGAVVGPVEVSAHPVHATRRTARAGTSTAQAPLLLLWRALVAGANTTPTQEPPPSRLTTKTGTTPTGSIWHRR